MLGSRRTGRASATVTPAGTPRRYAATVRPAVFLRNHARPDPIRDHVAARVAPRSSWALPVEDDALLARARRLVMRHGWNSTSHQTLDSSLRHWFSAADDAVVAYAEFAGVRVVAGAPVAASERLASVANEFQASSAAAGRQVCYFAAEERLRRTGDFGAHVIGVQPTWTAASWVNRFDASATLRAQRNRARNKGVTVHEAPSAQELGGDVAACYAAWRSAKRLPPLGFLAHTSPLALGADAQGDKRLFVARWPGPGSLPPRLVAYLTASPIPGRSGWLIDKVVRHPRAPNGTTELLLDAALRELASGTAHVTLGLAPLAGPAIDREGEAAPAWLRTTEHIARRWCAPFYDFVGLYEFKVKFRPDALEPVYLLTPGRRIGVRDVLAIVRAFLTRPV